MSNMNVNVPPAYNAHGTPWSYATPANPATLGPRFTPNPNPYQGYTAEQALALPHRKSGLLPPEQASLYANQLAQEQRQGAVNPGYYNALGLASGQQMVGPWHGTPTQSNINALRKAMQQSPNMRTPSSASFSFGTPGLGLGLAGMYQGQGQPIQHVSGPYRYGGAKSIRRKRTSKNRRKTRRF